MIEFTALAEIDRNNLIRLAELLEAGLLAPPFGALTLREHIPTAHVDSISACLDDIAQQQTSPAQMALVLRSFAAGTQVNRDMSQSIDVVVSGPDPSAAARDTGVVMRQLFNKARERVLVVGFVVHQGRSVFQALARAARRARNVGGDLVHRCAPPANEHIPRQSHCRWLRQELRR